MQTFGGLNMNMLTLSYLAFELTMGKSISASIFEFHYIACLMDLRSDHILITL
jgi:hypothetical protein